MASYDLYFKFNLCGIINENIITGFCLNEINSNNTHFNYYLYLFNQSISIYYSIIICCFYYS